MRQCIENLMKKGYSKREAQRRCEQAKREHPECDDDDDLLAFALIVVLMMDDADEAEAELAERYVRQELDTMPEPTQDTNTGGSNDSGSDD